MRITASPACLVTRFACLTSARRSCALSCCNGPQRRSNAKHSFMPTARERSNDVDAELLTALIVLLDAVCAAHHQLLLCETCWQRSRMALARALVTIRSYNNDTQL